MDPGRRTDHLKPPGRPQQRAAARAGGRNRVIAHAAGTDRVNVKVAETGVRGDLCKTGQENAEEGKTGIAAGKAESHLRSPYVQ